MSNDIRRTMADGVAGATMRRIAVREGCATRESARVTQRQAMIGNAELVGRLNPLPSLQGLWRRRVRRHSRALGGSAVEACSHME